MSRRFPWWRNLLLVIAVTGMTAGASAAGQRGKIEAVQRTVLSSELSARISRIPVKPGESFAAGETLVQFACEIFRAEKNKAESQLAQARRKLDNRQRLAKLDSIGQLEVDLARLAAKEARAELRITELNVKRCSLEVPFAGRVVTQFAREHQSVKAQEKLLKVVGRELVVRVIVPAEWIQWVQIGTQAKIHVDEINKKIGIQVTRIGASVDPVSHTVPVWAELQRNDETLRPGMSGDVVFPSKTDQGESGDTSNEELSLNGDNGTNGTD